MGLDGNRIGPRGKFLYESDDIGTSYILETDRDLAVAGLGTGSGAPLEYDPANPPTGVTVCPAPRRFTPRCVFVQDPVSGARKALTAFSSTADLYATSQPVSVNIDSLAFTSTGRKGEKLTY